MSLNVSFRHTDIDTPELILNGSALSDAGFTANELFHISQFSNGVIISLVDPNADLVSLINEVEDNPYEGIDSIRENGELYIAGDWLTISNLVEQPINIEMESGKIILKPKLMEMLA
ncbi:SymE family type I addiction module toxin [Xenorhabdus lircayensis]|uniref:Type I addiction module toxin, SymE family n=1 Tax=Xenorhabdus lircayensis TaxID=2763499 RepID=A0ABS0U8R7_9GAMM|nr:SymE family type I addiction module toxin [Xenorhabdus lircayensis]MBI6550263.1 type I addiction module toxin, SymE family [Xenorhabdus lircayensis]